MKKLFITFTIISFFSCSAKDSCEPTPILSTNEVLKITYPSANLTGTIKAFTCNTTFTFQGFVYSKSILLKLKRI